LGQTLPGCAAVAAEPGTGAAVAAGPISAVILAGGRGARMSGVDKGWVSFQGRALVEHVRARLLPQVGQIRISANRSLERYRALGHEVLPDDPRLAAFSGPLAGMLTGLEHAPTPWVVFVPCDAPRLPADLVARLAQASAGRQPAVASCAGRWQPVFCLLPASLAPRLAQALQEGERRPENFLRAVAAVEVPFADPQAFANINRPEDAAQAGDD
jgi:molybdopterin-guanine dinucleotide biosynthesis protein A